MGLCYGTPDFPTPSFTGHAKSGMKLAISSSSSSAASKTISSSSSSAASNSRGLLAGCKKKGLRRWKDFGTFQLDRFSFAELKEATKNFHDDALLGEGGAGYVYKGMLHGKQQSQRTKTVIAVKKLKLDFTHGYSNWLTEIQFFGRLSHPNIAKLLGFYQEEENLALVYEFMQKGSLNNHLFRKGSTAHLPWDARLKIMVGAARGLAFLHNSGRKIRYREFKTSNILLDGFYTAKLTDFGLVKPGPPERKSRRVRSTCGYAAPEYIATGNTIKRFTSGYLYVKSDVYGFGLVLLEILTGLSPYYPNRWPQFENLVERVKPFLSSKLKLRTLVDPGLEGNYCIDSAFQIAQIALKCLQTTPNKRPSMTEVVEELESIEAASANTIPRDA